MTTTPAGQPSARWLDPAEKTTPMWLRTLYASLPVTAVYVLHGGVHDLHPISINGRLRPDTTINAIWQLLRDAGFDGLITFDPLHGPMIRHTTGEPSRIRRSLNELTRSPLVESLRTPGESAAPATQGPTPAPYQGMDAIAEAVAQTRSPALALVIDYTSQTTRDEQPDDPDLQQLMLACLMLADAHALVNDRPVRFPWEGQGRLIRRPIIWLVDRPGDLPAWLTHGDGIRQIPIGTPDADTRRRIADLLLAGQTPPEQLPEIGRRFADATEGLSTRGMFEALQLARGTTSIADDIEGAVRSYRQGLSENPWQSSRLRELLADGETHLGQRVRGQDAAIHRVLDILKRSTLGLTGAHQVKPATAPRGVLYFAGPTGVGKTEMAKAIAELVFADERALLRFDMSEFQDDHAKIRLVGAPPSYIGHGAGGELTNAIQRRPHSIILFDEMDKAGREVYDLFLQILSDGRLTDGSGRTALFNEALIIFTSNQGVAAAGDLLRLDTTDPDQAARYEETIRRAVEQHFRTQLHRPELLGRLGDNIVVFRPIQGRVALDLAEDFIDRILANVRIRVGNQVSMTERARSALISAVTRPDDLANGGRGIATALENRLVNPLGRQLFALGPDVSVAITDVTEPGGHAGLRIVAS